MKRGFAIVAALALVVLLAGCGESIEQLYDAKQVCHKLSGVYTQYRDGWSGAWHSSCDLSDKGVKP